MEEDYRLFQLVKRNPINNCVDLSKNMRGKRNGVFYFTENFRIDFEKRMYELGRLEQENKELKEDIKNMYDEEAIINIISDEFNLTRSEVLNLLGGNEE